MACANKKTRILGTGKSPRLTTQERDETLAIGVLAMRMSVLRKRLKLSLRGFSNFLSHNDLYKWFCGSPMKQKGFDNRESPLAQSILSHNLWVLARLRIKQIEEIAQAA